MLAYTNNIMAVTTARHLNRNYGALATSVERLASGLRINSAKDDAAGLAVRELIRADVVMFKQASRNAMEGVNLLQTAESALGETGEVLIRMKELAEQASNDTYTAAQRTVMDEEFSELATEVTRIANSAKYNEKELLSAVGTTVKIHLGVGTMDITSDDMTADGLNIESTAAVKEVWTHGVYKSSADDIYIPSGDITAGSADIFSFEFSVDSGAVATDLDAYDATGVTLNELVAAVNTQAGYAAATAEYDSEYSAYRLHITAQTAGDTTMTWAGSNQITTLEGNANWIGSGESTDGSDSGGDIDLSTAVQAAAAVTAVDAAIVTKDSYRAKLGYWMTRLTSASTVLEIQAEALLTAESRISDVNIAAETAAMTRNQMLASAGVAILAQNNTMPQLALSLLLKMSAI